MTKARTLADFISEGSPLADGTISVSEVSGAAPLASPTFTGTITSTGDINLGDNDKAIFGAGSDLQIYHSGTSSDIDEVGTGNLRIGAENFVVQNADHTENMISAAPNGQVVLYHDNSIKFNTSSTGVDIAGTLTSDGLNVGGNILRDVDNNSMFISGGNAAATGANIGLYGSTSGNSNDILLRRNNVKFAAFDGATGDISFYDSQGSSQSFYWDASEERLGIGTTTPDNMVNIQESALAGRGASNGNTSLTLEHATDTGIQFFSATQTQLRFGDAASTGAGSIVYAHGDDSLRVSTNGSEAMRIDSSGNVGIGVTPNNWYTSGNSILQIGTAATLWGSTNTSMASLVANAFYDQTNSRWEYMNTDFATWYEQVDGKHIWFNTTSGTANNAISWDQAMTLDASGNLLVGTTSGYPGAGNTNTGNMLQNVGTGYFSRADGYPLGVNRNSDGTLINLGKDGSPVGSIGTRSGRLKIGDGDVGLFFDDANNRINPEGPSNTSANDASIDLGGASQRFKDLHLSGTIEIENGTGNVGVGKQALNSNTASNNTAVGMQALLSNTTAASNTAVGKNALATTTTGAENSALGHNSLLQNTTGASNTAIGMSALSNNTTANQSTAVGYQALFINTTGDRNAAFGAYAMQLNTTGSYNVAVGRAALINNTTASENTAVGYQSLYSNTTGQPNTAVGRVSMYSNTTGNGSTAIGEATLYSNSTGGLNVAVGRSALQNNTTANNNTAVGYQAAFSNTTDGENTAVGSRAFYSNTTGNRNVAIGRDALYSNTTADGNVAVGYASLDANTTAEGNTAVGFYSLSGNTTGTSNTALGFQALYANTTASSNTAVGYQAAYSNTTGATNTALGQWSLYDNTSGSNNVAIGRDALQNNTTAVRNTAVGYQAGYSVATGSYNVLIGDEAGKDLTVYSSTFVGSAAGENVTSGYGNSLFGRKAANKLTSGITNVIMGYYAGDDLTTGSNNTAVGAYSLYNTTTASNNTAVGHQALYDNTSGAENVAIGPEALYNNTTGDENIAIGRAAGFENTTGSRNTYIGDDANQLATTGSNNTVIGRFNGNQGGLDIRTSSNNIVLSDGGGNPRLHIDSSGTTDFLGRVNVTINQNANFVAKFENNAGGGYGISSDNSAGNHIFFYRNGAGTGSITDNGSSTSFNTSSDYRLKENVVELTGATDRLKQLNPSRFNFIADADTTVDGFIAHEVQSVVPEAITGTHNEVDDDGNPVYQGIDQSKLVPLLVATIKELEARITALEGA